MRFLLVLISLLWGAVAQAHPLVDAARSQIGVTVFYDPSYVGLTFPGGDLDRSRGVCSDVVIRALRDAYDFDLQEQVNRDMKASFISYPQNWGLRSTDRNIDHRRVPNLRTFFDRRGEQLPVTQDPAQYQPGDIVSWVLPGNLTHIGIVSNQTRQGVPLIIHNIGRGTQEEDILFQFSITGHFRFNP
ncbi:MAG: DUF1287 domain-containing protein [Pseudomonadota bacterium]